MSRAWSAVSRPTRWLVVGLLAAILALSPVATNIARAESDGASPVVYIALAGALAGLIWWLSQMGEDMISAEMAELGCPVPENPTPWDLDHCKRRAAYLQAHPETDPRVAELILHGRVAVGMSKAEVEAAVGKPTTINRTATAYGVREQWVYRHADGIRADYLYFAGDVLEAWQTSD